METKIKKYELKQNGKRFILSCQIFEDKLRFACIEYLINTQIVYIGEFSIKDLVQINSVFSSLTEIAKAQEIFDSLIISQKVSIELKDNYLNLNIIIKKEDQSDEKFTIKLRLFNKIETNINNKANIETKIEQHHLATESNKLDENLYSPITNKNEFKENIQQTTENITTYENNIISPTINSGIQEQQLINSTTNINVNTKEQLVMSPNLNKKNNTNNIYQEQYSQSENNINNINIQKQEFIQTSNNNMNTQQQNNTNKGEHNKQSPTFNYQENPNILSPKVNQSYSVDDYIKQFLQSGNISSQHQSTNNIISSQKQNLQENINYNDQLTHGYDINNIFQEKQIPKKNNPPEINNNMEINLIKNNNNEGQYISQPIQFRNNFSFKDNYTQQASETTNNINSLETYLQQSSSNMATQNQYIQSIQQPNTNITSNMTNTQTQYIQIPTSTITTKTQYLTQNQPLESQTVNYNMSQNQVKKTKRIKTEKIVLSLLPQTQEPKLEEVNYETSAQIYSPVKEPEIQPPQIIYKDNPELDNLRNQNAKLLEEINSLKSQMNIYIEENKSLKLNTTVKSEIPNNNYQEILLLRKEIEKLRIELSTYEEYKIQKENEINMQNMKYKNLLTRLKELEERNEDLRLYIEKLSQIKSEDNNTCEALSIQDTRLEIIRGDIIDNAQELELLTRRMCQNKYNKISLNLLYKAIVDSDKAEIFHRKCDSAEKTLVLIRSAKGKRFGGFTSCSWEGNSLEKKDQNAFIFSLDKMKIYNVIQGEDAIGCFPNFGPVFLGCQIRIYDEFFKNGGTTFEKGLNFDTKEDYELTGGLKKFDVKDIEVYSVELFK